MNKSTQMVAMLAVGAGLVWYLMQKSALAVAGTFPATQSVVLYPPNNAASVTITYGAIGTAPALAAAFTYGGANYVLQQDGSGNLYAFAS